MHSGMISLLSTLVVRRSFLCKYCSKFHTPRSFSSLQNNLYRRRRFLSLAGCGPQEPTKKSGHRESTGSPGSVMVRAVEEEQWKTFGIPSALCIHALVLYTDQPPPFVDGAGVTAAVKFFFIHVTVAVGTHSLKNASVACFRLSGRVEYIQF